MFRFLSVLLGVLCLSVPVSAGAFSQSSLNADWRFKREDVAAAAQPEFDDRDWSKATLPHSFNASDGDDGGSYYRGAGWYRKSLELKPVARGDRVYLQFDGAALVADVYVNGQHAGQHEGGYTAFRFDITRFLKAGRNLIAVRVDNAEQPHIAPFGGEATVEGGLYRGVSLIQARDIGIDWLDHGSRGVSVSSVLTLNSHADLKVNVAVRNQRARSVKMTVNTRIFSREGMLVMQMTRNVTLKAGEAETLNLAGRMVQPKLWNGRHDPYLYAAVTEISDGNETQERIVTHFGIRQVQIDTQHRFLLNGQPYPLVGVNLNTGRYGKGQAVSESDIVEDLDLIEDMGATAIRLSPYPAAQALYQEADRRGLIVVTGLAEGKRNETVAAHHANTGQQLRELVRQHINHPSIVLWETRSATEAAIVAAEDPSRQTLSEVASDNPALGLPAAGKPVGIYFTPKASVNEAATLSGVVDAFHQAHVGYPLAMIGYGTGGSIRHQSEAVGRIDPASGWHPEAFQAAYHEMAWAHLRARPAVWANFVWQAFDSAADGRNDGDQAGIDDSGLITRDRKVKKDAFWYYKAQWSAQPFVYVTGRRFHERTGRVTQVKVYSNQPSVTLSVNGVVVGTQTVQGGAATFNGVNLNMGSNTVRAESGAHVDEVRWTVRTDVPILN
ncbi:MAG: glycoside hydrolase family 2 TIM barrel-domain containing protein [Asticcacaulis sp.]